MNTTEMANKNPTDPSPNNCAKDFSTSGPSFWRTKMLISSGKLGMSCVIAEIPSVTSTVFASGSLSINSVRLGFPLVLDIVVASSVSIMTFETSDRYTGRSVYVRMERVVGSICLSCPMINSLSCLREVILFEVLMGYCNP